VAPTQVNTTSACEAKVVSRSESECDPTTASMPNALSLVALSVDRTRARIEKVSDLGWLSRRVSTEPPIYPKLSDSKAACECRGNKGAARKRVSHLLGHQEIAKGQVCLDRYYHCI
jgi:hypothetical protein